MRYVEAPEAFEGHDRSLFLAGGIMGCPNWQQHLIDDLRDSGLTLLNPRRAYFPMGDSSAAELQIAWEYRHLRKATAICFWFPCETLCPIALYELGAWSMTDKHLFVGVHPHYQRRQDVVLQTGLVRQNVKIVFSISDMVAQIRAWTAT